MSNVQTQKEKYRPSSTIDLQAATIEPYISSDYMSDRIRNKFRSFEFVRDNNGDIITEKGQPLVRVERDFWAIMELFTQDWRLGNTDRKETTYIRYNIDLCSDIMTVLPEEFNRPAFLLLERSVCTLETSGSKNGFVRVLFNSIFQNQKVTEEIPQKRSMFGLGAKSNKGV